MEPPAVPREIRLPEGSITLKLGGSGARVSAALSDGAAVIRCLLHRRRVPYVLVLRGGSRIGRIFLAVLHVRSPYPDQPGSLPRLTPSTPPYRETAVRVEKTTKNRRVRTYELASGIITV